MNDPAKPLDLCKRRERVDHVVDHLLGMVASGDEPDFDLVARENIDLQPDLEDELSKIRRILEARKRSHNASQSGPTDTLPGGITVPDDSEESAGALPNIPGYKILRRLGHGGQGTVYLARQESTGRKVALKVMRGEGDSDATAQAKTLYKREVQTLAALNHPNIVTVLDTGKTSDGSLFLAMNYISGFTLQECMENYQQQKQSDPAGLLRLFLKICNAIEAAHVCGIVHRDLKPGNIRVDERGEPFILDFGLAYTALDRVPRGAEHPFAVSGEFLGSLPWCSPEQAEGDPDKIDIRSDVYSLGVILYQLLTGGHFPYEVVGNIRDVLNNILTAEPTPPSRFASAACTPRPTLAVNETIERIVLKALAKRRADRYQSAGELSRDISQYLSGLPTSALPTLLAREQRVVWRTGTMSITHGVEREQLVSWAERIRSLLSGPGKEYITEGIAQAITQLRAERFMLAILGKAKRGKSTLVNALLGRRDDLVAPIDKLPASSAISRFGWAERDEATVNYRDGRRETISFQRIREFVTEESNPENAKGIVDIDVRGSFSGLDHDLVLVDTPGAGSLHSHHDALLQSFIPQSDAVIFLVTARMPLDRDEVELLKQIKAAEINKVFFVLNRVDESNQLDIEAAIAHNRSQLDQIGIHTNQIHRISAKQAFQGEPSGCGVQGLFDDISAFLASNRGRFLSQRFVARICGLVGPALQSLSVELANAGRSTEEIEGEIKRLSAAKEGMQEERKFSEREFSLAWFRAIDTFERAVVEARPEVLVAMSKRITDSSLLSLKSTSREIPAFLAQTVEEHLLPAATVLEQEMRAASARLEATYPSIDLRRSGAMELRMPRTGASVALGAIGGGAAVATGVGLVSVGATTAASIVAANAAAVAAAAAATTTITVPTVLGSTLATAASNIPWIGGWLSSVVGGLGTGTASIVVPGAPAALTATPFWVAMSGPVGWTLAGVGVLVVPLAWTISKAKARNELEKATKEQVINIFDCLQKERCGPLRQMGTAIVDEFRVRLDRQLNDIEASLRRVQSRRPDPDEVNRMSTQVSELHAALLEQTSGASSCAE